MRVKRILLLGGMALALAAFAGPAVASGAEIKDEGQGVNDKEIELRSTPTVLGEGVVYDKTRFEALGSGVECVMHATVTIDGATIKVTSFTITTSTCASFGNPYSNCEIETDEPTPATFAVAVDAGNFTITAGTIHQTYKTKAGAPECFTKQNDITFKNVTMTPNKVKAIGTVALGGEVRIDTALSPNPGSKATLVGTLQVVGPDAGTYEIA